MRSVSRCEPCADALENVRQRERRDRYNATHPDVVSCTDCGVSWTRTVGRSRKCDACRAARERKRKERKAEAVRAKMAAKRPVVPSKPVAVRTAWALVPSLATGAEERRQVSVLSRVRVVCGHTGLRLVRVHVQGEATPRDIAVERIEEGGA